MTSRKILLRAMTAFLLWVLGYGLYALSALTMRPQEPDRMTDAVVVFTGGSGRIEEGLRLLDEGRAPRLYISGVHADTPKADLLRTWSGSPESVEIGQSSTTTTQNAEEVRGWLAVNPDIHTLRLVTSNYHMNRSLIELKNAVPDIEILAHPIVQPDINAAHRYFWHVLFSEYHKALYRWVFLIFAPHPAVHGPHD